MPLNMLPYVSMCFYGVDTKSVDTTGVGITHSDVAVMPRWPPIYIYAHEFLSIFLPSINVLNLYFSKDQEMIILMF